MKKVLLATSALTLLAGAAAAEVGVSGSSRMGVTSTGGTTTTTYRTRINFTLSGETDGGLTFGAFTRVQMNNAAAGTVSGSNVWISNGTATLTIGNTGGATATAGRIFGCAIGFTGSCVDMANSTFSWVTFSSGGAGANVVRLDFALGSANVSISGGNGNDNELAANFALGNANVGVSYDAGAGATGGTQLTVDFDAGSANIGVNYARTTGGATGYSVTASMAMGNGTLYAVLGNNTAAAAVWALSYSIGLGGGATAAVSVRSVGGTVTTDAGLKFSF